MPVNTFIGATMRTITFAVSKGGVGKSLMTANVGAALAKKGKKVILVEGDPNRPLQLILNLQLTSKDSKLDEVIERDLKVEKAVYHTDVDRLFLIPSGVSLQSYFDVEPTRFAKKVMNLEADFLFIDTPFPLGKAAFLSLGFCEYFIPILTEDEFVLCVESAIDTIRLGEYFFRCVPIGFVLNRIKSTERFTEKFVEAIEELLEIPCITQVKDNPIVAKSYGGAGSEKAFLAYRKLWGTEFAKSVEEIAVALLGKLPATKKKDVVRFMQDILEPLKT